jgi:hypothetical protein
MHVAVEGQFETTFMFEVSKGNNGGVCLSQRKSSNVLNHVFSIKITLQYCSPAVIHKFIKLVVL